MVETERGEAAAREFKAQFAEVSARSGEGVDKVRMVVMMRYMQLHSHLKSSRELPVVLSVRNSYQDV